jgi:conjugative transfer signal peptidase TraF
LREVANGLTVSYRGSDPVVLEAVGKLAEDAEDVAEALGATRPTAPVLVWNASASVPLGLYRIQSGPVRRGDLVLIRLPRDIADLADRRGYLPKSAYLIKYVVAVASDRVCRLGDRILVNGVFAARALRRDRSGRRMPVWHGCRMLALDEVFLLARDLQSFDSRYFGPLPVSAIVGRAVVLCPRPSGRLNSLTAGRSPHLLGTPGLKRLVEPGIAYGRHEQHINGDAYVRH